MRPSREEVQEWPESRFQRYDAPDKVRRARGEHGEVVVDAVAVAVLRQVAGVAVIERGAAQALRKLVAAAGDACRLDQHLARRLAHPERAGHADRAVDCREPFCLQPRHRAHADRDIAQCRLRRHPTHRRSRRLDLQSRTCSNAPSFHADARVGTIPSPRRGWTWEEGRLVSYPLTTARRPFLQDAASNEREVPSSVGKRRVAARDRMSHSSDAGEHLDSAIGVREVPGACRAAAMHALQSCDIAWLESRL